MKLQCEQTKEGYEYPAYAWPGGYPIYYLTKDNGVLCPACANGKNGSKAGNNHEDPQWKLMACDIYWEGDPMQCDHCNASIESAYGHVCDDECRSNGCKA